MGRILLFGFACFMFSPQLLADEPEQAIRKQIQNLGHSQFHVREKASQELEKLGEVALAELKNIPYSVDPEIRQRIDLLIPKIQKRLNNETYLKAKSIRLKFVNTPLAQAIADVNQKTGLNFQLDSNKVKNQQQLITLDIGTVPFWLAVD